jgi:hypothetical protein
LNDPVTLSEVSPRVDPVALLKNSVALLAVPAYKLVAVAAVNVARLPFKLLAKRLTVVAEVSDAFNPLRFVIVPDAIVPVANAYVPVDVKLPVRRLVDARLVLVLLVKVALLANRLVKVLTRAVNTEVKKFVVVALVIVAFPLNKLVTVPEATTPFAA